MDSWPGQAAGSHGELVIQQPRTGNVRWIGHYRYEWDVRLSENVPIDLSAATGAGDCVVDLVGDLDDDLEVSIEGGVGRLTVLLPKDVGARIEVTGG